MTTRRLAAILAADVAGYSAAMERDEEGTAATVRALRREVIEPRLAEHQGRLIKTTGDGFLAEFASPIAALKCALAIQQRPDGGLQLRIGLNLGDVIIEDGGDLLGEGVNIAARLEGLAEPGGILVSDKIVREVEGKVEATFEDRGEQQVKNISKPLRAYAVRSGVVASGVSPSAFESKPLPLPDKPSIAVLPFQNMSGDPDQDYFADGMVEDIITALSRFKQLFVIARNSSFTYKGKAVDIKQVGRELGVRYVLEGSVRKAGGRVRITGQLIEAATGAHLWADKFDGALHDIFELQDQITERVVGQITPHLEHAEFERIRRKPLKSLDAYDTYMRGRDANQPATREANDEALALYYRAIQLDPTLAPAYASAAAVYNGRKTNGWMTDEQAETREAKRLADIAIRLGHDDAYCLTTCVLVYAFVLRDAEFADGLIERALALNPNNAAALRIRGHVHVHLGRHELAIEALHKAERLSPVAPGVPFGRGVEAWALMFLHKYDEACLLAAEVNRLAPVWTVPMFVLFVAHAHAGRVDEARRWMQEYRVHQPHMRVSNLASYLPNKHAPDLALMLEGARIAGMPE